MSVSQAEVDVRASLERCLASGGLIDRFYALFVAASPAVARHFEKTDFERQKEMLKDSLYALLLLAESRPGGTTYALLEGIARRHSRAERNIEPELYELWLECLMKAIGELDPEFTAELDQSWRTLLGAGIEFMRSRR